MENKVKYDYSKLLGKIKEKGYTHAQFAEAIGRTASTVSLRFSGDGYFTQLEINKACDLLGIAKNEIAAYFFTK